MSRQAPISPAPPPAGGPFDLADDDAYRRWRDAKLAGYPASADELIVEVDDPAALTDAEHGAMLARLRKANMALYASRRRDGAGKETLRRVGARFGLLRLDANLCADEDAITPLRVVDGGERRRYIPYTDRPLKWHTDGYYNLPHEWIRGIVLHCAQDAAEGGDNGLMDHEIAYILMRDEDPALVAALMHPAALTIPPNEADGEEIRGARTNPVFAVDPATGCLHMNYTERTRNIAWRDDGPTRAAAAWLGALLGSDSPYVFRHRMAPGQGLVCNNVLHDRRRFKDDPEAGRRRLVYRGRYYDRVAGTALRDIGSEGRGW